MEIGNKNDNINNSQRNRHWTNERHSNFLSSMESSFVRAMLEKNVDTTTTTTAHHHNSRRVIHHHTSLPLDRYIPDISESTLDLQTRKITAPDPMTRVGSRQRERPPTHPYKISHDQVVPQLEKRASAKGEKHDKK